MQSIITLSTIWIIILSHPLFSQCDNRALHFDGIDDFVEIPNSILPTTNNFTVEFWVKLQPSATSPTCVPRYLYTLTGFATIRIYECNGVLYAEEDSPSGIQTVVLSTISYNTWYHVALNTAMGQLEIALDCTPVGILLANGLYDVSSAQYIGSDDNPPAPNQTLKGEIDEFRIWDYPKTPMQLCKELYCVADTADNHLLVYYRMDQGVANDPIGFPANDNSSIVNTEDLGPYNHDGYLVNFGLTGQQSNFVCSNSPMIYPIFEGIKPVFTDYATRLDTLSSICSGDPFHLCLKDTSGMAVANMASVDTLIWEYNDGTSWNPITIPSFNGICFGVDPGLFTIDCTTNPLGYEDWMVRCSLDVKNAAGDSCWYVTDTTLMRIFCPLDFMLQGVQASSCETDTIDYVVDITSAFPFITLPAASIRIDWTFTDGNGTIALTSFEDMTQATLPDIASPPGSACFTATITDTISTKTNTVTACTQVEARPICGQIMADTLFGSMRTVDLDEKIFSVCRCDDGQLFATSPFTNTHYIWQYSVDLTLWTDFVDNNSLANTNKLPPASPGDTTFVRVVGYPLSDPDTPYVCMPCFSDTLRIVPTPPIVADSILGPDTLCCDSSIVLTLQNFDPLYDHIWYCNGDSVAANVPSLTTSMGGRYYVVMQDSCMRDTTAFKYVHLCKVIPSISCPLAPNTCPRVGEIVYLSGCASSSDCPGSLTYTWSWDSGTLISQSGCDLQHIPDPGGTTYTLTVTHSNGCTATTTSTIVPCP